MRMFGNDILSPFAAGTILNEVVGLEVICQNGDKHSRIHVEDHLLLEDKSRSRSVERGKMNFKHQLVKQELLSQVVCLTPPLCLFTEFMSRGRVFDDLQNRKSILKLLGTLKITIDVTEGMSYLHQNIVVHRGLKVANLWMDKNKVLMTVNAAVFGVAQLQSISNDAVAPFLEGHGVVFNEPASLPPFRDHNHQILLKEGTRDIASRSYSSVQKVVIEKDALSRVHTSDIVISLGGRKGGPLQESFVVYKVGCSKLGQRKMFFQLLETILKIGNRGNGEIESAPHKIEEPKHRTERVFRVFKRNVSTFC
ncbi:hypothetical protein SASPL_149217 [Salvia splendens]|uniref:Protein kinase domain-containing protein n=1 Tax=Salvia splendens TaxID=180675 RepID=A0A8X8WAR2_SALSN|nr:hypothetical protein SASPL_149217 [Salvia splendens]